MSSKVFQKFFLKTFFFLARKVLSIALHYTLLSNALQTFVEQCAPNVFAKKNSVEHSAPDGQSSQAPALQRRATRSAVPLSSIALQPLVEHRAPSGPSSRSPVLRCRALRSTVPQSSITLLNLVEHRAPRRRSSRSPALVLSIALHHYLSSNALQNTR